MRYTPVSAGGLLVVLLMTATAFFTASSASEWFDQTACMVSDGVIEVRWYPPPGIRDAVDHYSLTWMCEAYSDQIHIPASLDHCLFAADSALLALPPGTQVQFSIEAREAGEERLAGTDPSSAHLCRSTAEDSGPLGDPPMLPILGLSDRGFDDAQFPTLFAWVGIDSAGQIPRDSLLQSAFEAYEDGALITDCFQASRAGGGYGSQADFVFLIDVSASMADKIQIVQANIIAFIAALEALDYDAKFGYVRFGHPTGDNPRVMNGGDFYEDPADFIDAIPMVVSGDWEPGCQAAIDAVMEINFRPGSLKQLVLITDEDSDEGDCQMAIALCNTKDINIHGAVDCDEGDAQSQYCDGLVGQTGGLVFGVTDPFDQLFD
ncbi:MAG: VWA domain-containing protein, partial [Candidatus Eisenbacteria sp.]|nr:VWA domain-containing protein [Candidatus Eisenbacteria bacterium]